MASPSSSRSTRLRWATASELLRVVHATPGITRTAARDRLALSSGAATELAERLRRARLLAEVPAAPHGPGRPTTVLGAHPRGPLAAVVDLRTAGWSVALADLAGATRRTASGAYGRVGPVGFLPRVADAVAAAVRGGGGRVRCVVAVVAGTVSGRRLLQFATRGWDEADLGVLTSRLDPGAGIGLVTGNDATLGGIAEARSGAARAARVDLHILVAVGVGGALLVDGRPVAGSRGAGGEYGHLPFGDPALRCPCGAHGCWDLTVDGRAIARHLGEAEPADPVAYAHRVLERVRSGRGSERELRAVELTARSLASGIAGLVNLHDPDAVTIGGLAIELRAAAPRAFDDAFAHGLMALHRSAPPPVLDAAYGMDGPVRGATDLAFDQIASPAGLARWEASVQRHFR